jgi:K+-transporting ATPase c subunit
MSNPTPQNNQPSTDNSLPILALVLAFVFPLAGAIIGHIALKQMREGRLDDTNKGLAKAGMIVGWVFTGLIVAYFALVIVWVVYVTTTGIDYFD